MNRVDRLYQWLADGPSPAADRALTAALEHAEQPYLNRLIACLLQRRNSIAWAGLIGQYGSLSENARERLRAEQALYPIGISIAMRSGPARVRLNALRAYAECPTERIVHILPGALRDDSVPVRELAESVLQSVAAGVYDRRERAVGTSDAGDRQLSASVAAVTESLLEVLRTIDLHLRVETLEPCLWFSEELGNELWDAMHKTRSRVGHIVREQLISWNSPRIAGFLLRASTMTEHRRTAAETLAGWNAPEQVAALLRRTRMLGEPAIRRAVRSIRRPDWFTRLSPDLEEIPGELRGLAPQWVCAAGFDDEHREVLLSRWSEGSFADLKRAAEEALEELRRQSAAHVEAPH